MSGYSALRSRYVIIGENDRYPEDSDAQPAAQVVGSPGNEESTECPGRRLPAITHYAYEALLKVYGVAHAEEFMRWLVVDVCGETWQEPPATPPAGEGG